MNRVELLSRSANNSVRRSLLQAFISISSLWRALRTGDEKYNQATRFWAKIFRMAVVPLFVAISVESWKVRPSLAGYAMKRPFCWMGLLFIIVAACSLVSGLTKGRERRAFVGSNFLLVGPLVTGSAALFPVMLYSTLAPENSLTAYSVASGSRSLLLASVWWPVGFVLATIYFVFISRRYTGKVSLVRDNQGYY